MKKYTSLFKFVTYYILAISILFGFLSLINRNFTGLIIFALIFIIWFKTYDYLKTQTTKAFIVSYTVLNIFWLPLLYRTYKRVEFINENGGFERTDGYGSPLAFLIGMTFEQIFFIPLSILFVFGIYTFFMGDYLNK